MKDEFDSDDIHDEDDDNEEVYGENGVDGLDIPDVPIPPGLGGVARIVGGMFRDSLVNALEAFAEQAEEESRDDDDNDAPPRFIARQLSVTTTFDKGRVEHAPGFTRMMLSLKDRYGRSYATLMAKTLTNDLKRYADKLLFGLIDDLYLHCYRNYMFNLNRVNGGVRFYWSTEESPYRMNIAVSTIEENRELTYLLIGDLIEELVDDTEMR